MLNKFMNEIGIFIETSILRGLYICIGFVLLIVGLAVLGSNPIAGAFFMIYSGIALIGGIFNLIKHEEDI